MLFEGIDDRGDPCVDDGIGLAEALLGLPGFRVLVVREDPAEVVVEIETTASRAACSACGSWAVPHERRPVTVRDLPCFGRPARLVWHKRRWRCVDADCDAKTWTERSEYFSVQVSLTDRAGAEACRQVGENARPVSELAEEFGVCWATIMGAVVEHGTPLVDDPGRVGPVAKLGVDETSWLKANRRHRTLYATAMVDLDAGTIIDMVPGNASRDLQTWLERQPPAWLAGIGIVTTDLAESYRAGLSPRLDHATRVADPFHVVKTANHCLDKVRRRVQNETLHHRGRKDDPLFKIRRILLTGGERLNDRGHDRMMLGLRLGDPKDEVLGAWLAKEAVRDIYLTDDPADAALLLAKAIVGCLDDEVPEINTLGRTLQRWSVEILNHHRTGASNGPTEAINLSVKRVKRCGYGHRNFDHYRLRVLLHAGRVTWPQRPTPPRIRTRRPYSNA